ncbi:hypothetical protein LP419_14190 [Massilia sp. H-1]|nr:hypothetical protein LP419_14190 [Massilia sp. H-1]
MSDYRNQLLDYYIELTDSKGNVTRTDIQQVFVGAGRYRATTNGSGFVEDINGTVPGVYPFLAIDSTAPSVPGTITPTVLTDRSVTLTWLGVHGQRGRQRLPHFPRRRSGRDQHRRQLHRRRPHRIDRLQLRRGRVRRRGQRVGAQRTAHCHHAHPDTVAPGAPGQPVASAVTSSTLTLSWAAASDNYGVSQYQIRRDGVQVGTSSGTTFGDSGLVPSTAYSYTVVALDSAGNVSATSPARSVTTLAGNVARVYYKLGSGWSAANMHYAPTGGTWTAVPGTPMPLACTGWSLLSVNLGSATGLQAAFNNGA